MSSTLFDIFFFFLSRKIKIFIFIETIKLILSVALGSQLANVFLHLLPETFAHPHKACTKSSPTFCNRYRYISATAEVISNSK
jgi:hypothetical protein